MKTLTFTGSRNINKKDIDLAHRLHEAVEDFINKGFVNFNHGNAVGADAFFARSVIKHKEKYPHIKLITYVPCLEQDKFFSEEDKAMYKHIIEKSDKVIQVTDEPYSKYCMKLRNIKMIDDCSQVLSIWCGDKLSGTWATIQLAVEAENVKGIYIIKT